MRVIAPAEAVGIGREARTLRALNLELLGLLAASVVVLFGLLLGHSAKVARLDEAAPAAGVIPLHALKGAADLEPALTMFVSPFERQEAARALYRRATADPRLEHVGGLAAVTIPAAEIRADRRFVQLRARMDLRPAATDVPVLSQAD